MNTNVDTYFTDGCGRCKFGGTPECKVHNWPDELKQLRRIILDCGLNEESKWGVPCYTYKNSNVLMLAAFKEYASLSFFKGTLLSDTGKILDKPGESSQAVRMFKFTDVQDILKIESTIKAYIFEAIEVEKAGLKVKLKKISDYEVPEEFQSNLDEMPALKAAFEALTPGRQRAYLIHFSQAKQSKTRIARIEKNIPQILNGKGFNDR